MEGNWVQVVQSGSGTLMQFLGPIAGYWLSQASPCSFNSAIAGLKAWRGFARDMIGRKQNSVAIALTPYTRLSSSREEEYASQDTYSSSFSTV